MKIGEVIRKYRKSKNMTQEEMANRLGVTAPAVNKWENGNSLPDIMLLAPIARLLDITLDTLLSYQEELTLEEINNFTYELDDKLKNGTYENGFQWAKDKLQQYPNSEMLTFRMIQRLDAQRAVKDIPDSADYDNYICDCYVRILDSKDEELRNIAADLLFNLYVRKEQYDKAEKYLTYFSKENPERKRKQALIYSKTNRINEAYKAYEELLFTGYGMINLIFHSIYMLAMQDENMKKAHSLVDKQKELAKIFEMGGYYEASCVLELAVAEKDCNTAAEAMKRMLESSGSIGSFCDSALYEHMIFSGIGEDFSAELKNNLLKNFRDEETYAFLKDDKRWQELVK
ncbi:helix-turn-helix transcriptional regulator [Muricomes intestini]|uniref:helix-turn-helix domain-containing protein n=1 Tax=Muricomes intestini TaxID=1796634 RepID=UPI000E99E87D|nr:transcriptional regulator [Lachnospiraceae bacterium]HCR82864.1 transcriptional regulator [Lachnospiraceae bacterium]